MALDPLSGLTPQFVPMGLLPKSPAPPPQPPPSGFVVHVGVARPVTFMATLQADGTIMWSADSFDPSGNGVVGNGRDILSAVRALEQGLAFHSVQPTP